MLVLDNIQQGGRRGAWYRDDSASLSEEYSAFEKAERSLDTKAAAPCEYLTPARDTQHDTRDSEHSGLELAVSHHSEI